MPEPVQPAGAADPSAAAPCYLSIRDACAFTGLTRTRVFSYLAQGRVEAVKAGRQTLIRRSSLDELLASLPAWRGRGA